MILSNSVFRMGKNYYPKMYLEECKYIVKENQIDKNIEDDLEISSDYNFNDKFFDKEANLSIRL